MISKAIQAYATIDCLWTEGKDLIEIYAIMSVPALTKAIDEGCNAIDPLELSKFFHDYYGLENVTIGASAKFLKRLESKHKMVKKDYNSYTIKIRELEKFKSEYPENKDVSEQLDRILNDIVFFAKSAHNQVITSQEAEKGLKSFFDKYAGEIVIEQKTASDITSLKYKRGTYSQRLIYIVADFIEKLNEAGSGDVDILLSFAVGKMVANAISLRDFGEIDGSLSDLHIYLDSPIIFNLMGLSGEIPRQMAKELLDRLKILGAKLHIGQLHEDEVKSSIQFAIKLLREDFPELDKGNRIFYFARDNNLTVDDLELRLQGLKNIKNKYNIDTPSLPPKEAGFSETKVDSIFEKIKSIFSSDGKRIVPPHRQRSIKRDAKILYQVMMIRDGNIPTNFKESKAILITNNAALCEAMSDQIIDENISRFPAALLTETVSAILWLNHPDRDKEAWKDAFLSKCHEALRVRTDILRKFYKDIKSKYHNYALTDEDYLSVINSREIGNILREETFNDESLYSDETAVEALRRLKIREEYEKKQRNELLEEQRDKILHLSIRKANSGIRSIGVIMFLVCFAIITLGNWIQNIVWHWILIILGAIIGAWSAIGWTDWIPTRKFIWNKIVLREYKRISIDKVDEIPDFDQYWDNRKSFNIS